MRKQRLTFFEQLRLGILLLFFLAGCTGQQQVRQTEETEETPLQQVTVTVPSENLRDAPSGNRIGETTRGQVFSLKQRRGNWCQVGSEASGDAWIWAPSLGLASVSPLTLSEWIGTKAHPKAIDDLTDTFGPPVEVVLLASQAVIYEYNEAGALFGTRQLDRVRVWVDRPSRTVVRVEFDLPPFTGKRNELLASMGLPGLKASKTDFDKASYENTFDGIGFLQMTFAKGNFEKVEMVTADRYSPANVEKWADLPEKKVTIEDGLLTLEVTMHNRSTSVALSCPMVELELVEAGRRVGTFVLGPGDVHLKPGEQMTFRMPTTVKESQVDVMQVAARAELIDVLIVPPGGGL